jgi:7-keto-8-aminopelargonate synthetase-like enzyme
MTVAYVSRNISGTKHHAWMLLGVHASAAKYTIFRHNKVGHLEQQRANSGPGRPRIVDIELVYLMNVDVAPRPEICTAADAVGRAVSG